MAFFPIIDGPNLDELKRSVWKGRGKTPPRAVFSIEGGRTIRLILTRLEPISQTAGEFTFEGFTTKAAMKQKQKAYAYTGRYSPAAKSGECYFGG